MFTFKVDDEIELALVNPMYADKMFQLIDSDRDYLLQWLAWPKFTKAVSDCDKFARDMLKSYADGESMVCHVLYKNEVVGVAGYNAIIHSLKKVELGYWLSSGYQGKGIMTRVCKALIDHAFSELAMEKVQIAAAVDNKPSRAICERLGMTLEGTITNAENLNGRIVGHAMYGLAK